MIRPNEKGLDGGDWVLILCVVSLFHAVPTWLWVIAWVQFADGLIYWGLYYEQEKKREADKK
jgi:hypothetical protein